MLGYNEGAINQLRHEGGSFSGAADLATVGC